MTAGGALVGFSVGIYLLFDRALFSYFVQIAQFEVLSYFLSVFMPSFIILIVIGYLLATTLGLKRTNLSSLVPLCVLSLLSMVLSALSIFYFISFLGGFLTLVVLIRAYAKPAFRSLSPSLAFFFLELGAMFVVSFSMLFLLMWIVSNIFVTYAMGFFGSSSPVALLLVGVLAFLLFFVVPLWGHRGTDLGLSGALGFAILVLSYLFVIQSEYVLFNASAYVGMSLLIAGFALMMTGNLMYFRLFFFVPEAPVISVVSTLLQGRYCPYCGKPRLTAVQNVCSSCGRSLTWTPYAPFCSACGRLVSNDAQVCPHCHEDIKDKQIHFNLRETQEQAIANKVVIESEKKKSWMMKGFLRITRSLQTVGGTLRSAKRFLSIMIERMSLTLKEVVFMIILTYLFGFIAFVSYKRVALMNPLSSKLTLFYYGFPLEWLQVSAQLSLKRTQVYDINILWISLVLDAVLYFLASFALVYGVTRLRR